MNANYYVGVIPTNSVTHAKMLLMATNNEARTGTPLVEWLREQYGPNKRYKSARQLSFAAGRNQNLVNIIEERGQATADVLVDLARALDISPLRLFVLAGWITADEFEADVSTRELEFIGQWRRLDQEDRGMLAEMMERILRLTSGQA